MKAIVTGHSRGLGAALASALAARGAAVLGLARGRHGGLGGRVEEHACDLGDPAALRDLATADGALARFLAGGEDGPVLLVNNAGVVDPIGPAGTLDPAEVARAITVNVTAALVLTEAVLAATEGRTDRRVLHISSGAGRKAFAGWSVYCATKAALDHHARTVAEDRRPGLRIASVAPGVVDTAMQATLRSTPAERFVLRDSFVSLKETGSLVSPENAAAALVDHLLSPRFGSEPVADIRSL